MDYSILRRFGKVLVDNSPTILTNTAVVGVIVTAFLTSRATIKAVEIIKREEEAFVDEVTPPFKLNSKEKAEVIFREGVWVEFVPAAMMGLCTIACIIGANRIGASRTAAAMAAFAISEKALDEYRSKVVEKIGENKERKVRDEIAQDRINRADIPPEILMHDEGLSVLCLDLYTGRPFISDMESLRRAENDINYRVNHDMYASLSDFYELIGLPRTTMSDDFGWNADRLLELDISHGITPGGRPCLTMDFRVAPIRGYHRLQ